MPLDGGVIVVIYHFTLFIWIKFLRIIRIVIMRYNKLMRNHSNRFSIQKTHNCNPSFSSRALKGTKCALYMFSPSFALRNCAECDSHIAVRGCKSICLFFIVYWVTASYRCHANLLRAFLLHTYFSYILRLHTAVLSKQRERERERERYVYKQREREICVYIYVCVCVCVCVCVWIFEHVNALSDSVKRRGVC